MFFLFHLYHQKPNKEKNKYYIKENMEFNLNENIYTVCLTLKQPKVFKISIRHQMKNKEMCDFKIYMLRSKF